MLSAQVIPDPYWEMVVVGAATTLVKGLISLVVIIRHNRK